ncbi:MAG: hypothetical protein A3B90_02940 [Candidatus Magasanikbacteria bacterium RIFCSPHIGHO2_02_FULL_41_13]|uniref:DUF4190 domain-containing protein n=1 Tax=Candidatus Magasanikbacteria bacterium RIFCSPHIGHO2_02_FULL_41_13 TaxID=1798676 RepID=A0A1F6M335_9BACT|nr:MAG: hypothetical protein A3B90_02940 [Candidatus Magasanikbacteria bacterium RIFCSPHIGHO2_02_FULL_41_13]
MKLSRFFTFAAIIITALSGLFSFSSIVLAQAAPAADAPDDSYGLTDTAKRSGLAKYGSSVPVLAGSIIGTALSMISVIFFILMVYGGFLWMTAHGDEGTVTKAKDTIIAAIIGIIIILASYAITNYVTTSVVSSPATPAAPEAPAAP